MIQFNIHTDKGVQRITSPASWRELTLEQLIRLETEWDRESPLALFAIITGLDIQLLENSREKGLEDTMLAICAFAYDQPQWDNLPKPEHFEIAGKIYKAPKNIEEKLLGQKIRVSQIVIKAGEDLLTQLPKIIAIYMQEVIDGKYDGNKVDDLEKEILKSPAMDAYGLGRFFFRKSIDLINIGELSSKQSPTIVIPTTRLLNGLRRLKDSANLTISV